MSTDRMDVFDSNTLDELIKILKTLNPNESKELLLSLADKARLSFNVGNTRLKENKDVILKLDDAIKQLKIKYGTITKLDNDIKMNRGLVEALDNSVKTLNNKIQEKESSIRELENDLKLKHYNLKNLEDNIEKKNKDIEILENREKGFQQTIISLEKQIHEKQIVLDNIQLAIDDKNDKKDSLDMDIENKNSSVKELGQEINNKKNYIIELGHQIDNKKKNIEEIERQIIIQTERMKQEEIEHNSNFKIEVLKLKSLIDSNNNFEEISRRVRLLEEARDSHVENGMNELYQKVENQSETLSEVSTTLTSLEDKLDGVATTTASTNDIAKGIATTTASIEDKVDDVAIITASTNDIVKDTHKNLKSYEVIKPLIPETFINDFRAHIPRELYDELKNNPYMMNTRGLVLSKMYYHKYKEDTVINRNKLKNFLEIFTDFLQEQKVNYIDFYDKSALVFMQVTGSTSTPPTQPYPNEYKIEGIRIVVWNYRNIPRFFPEFDEFLSTNARNLALLSNSSARNYFDDIIKFPIRFDNVPGIRFTDKIRNIIDAYIILSSKRAEKFISNNSDMKNFCKELKTNNYTFNRLKDILTLFYYSEFVELFKYDRLAKGLWLVPGLIGDLDNEPEIEWIQIKVTKPTKILDLLNTAESLSIPLGANNNSGLEGRTVYYLAIHLAIKEGDYNKESIREERKKELTELPKSDTQVIEINDLF